MTEHKKIRAVASFTDATVESLTIDEWQAAFWELYGGQDRASPLYMMMLHMFVHATHLAEAARKGRLAEALPHVPHMFSWLANLATKVRVEDKYADLGITGWLSDIVWHKYPYLCCLCAQAPCVCASLGVDTLSKEQRRGIMTERALLLDSARAFSSDRPERINDWVHMFHEIYGPAHSSLTLSHKMLHFVEEVGELEIELRTADRVRAGLLPPGTSIDLGGEVADLVSWIASICVHVDKALDDARHFTGAFTAMSSEAPGLSLSAWLWREFGAADGIRCYVCRGMPCSCLVHIARR